jgi:hypothetical protein
MDKELMSHHRNLEILSVTEQEEEKKLSIAQKKAIEKELASKYGTLAKAKQVLGFIKINSETMHTLYSSNPELRALSLPPKVRRA